MANTNRARAMRKGKNKRPKQHATLRTDELSRVVRGGNPSVWNQRCRDTEQKEQVA